MTSYIALVQTENCWQSDLKAMIGYSSISHMGVVLLGVSTMNQTGLLGVTLQMSAHGLVAGVLFLLIGLLYERTHTREVADYSSLVRVAPRFAFFTTLGLLTAMSIPGTAGFVAELHALFGGFERWGWWILGLSTGMVVSAAYAVRTMARLLTGPVSPRMSEITDLRGIELLAAGLLSLGIIALGLAPTPALNLTNAPVAKLSAIQTHKNVLEK